MFGKSYIKYIMLILMLFGLSQTKAEEADLELAYIDVYPIIVTNYQRAKGKRPGFVQISVEIAVYGPVALEVVEKNMPLIRDTIIEFISFTDETMIKDIGQRSALRDDLKKKVNKILEKHTGYAYADDLVITRFMWE